MGPQVFPDGRCSHCLSRCGTGGCPTCTSSLTYCTCGALMRCGCGMSFDHDATKCPNIIMPAEYTTDLGFTTPYLIVIPAVTVPVYAPEPHVPLVVDGGWKFL